MIHRFDPSWGTHLVPLIECLENSRGPVLELGLGISSTPVLHALCEDSDRFLLSLDNDPVFVEMFKKYRSSRHKVELVGDWDLYDLDHNIWAVALIDHKPDARRIKEIIRIADLTTYVIIHDSEPDKNDLYHYDEIYPLFKYKFDYRKTPVHTTVLSNFHDPNFLRNS